MGTTSHANDYVTPMARIAITYATELGFSLFPCAYGTKFPLRGSHGHLDASDDPEVIRKLFAQRPRLNIALSAIASKVVIIDVDVRNAGDETLAELEGKHATLPHTPRVLSGSGDGSTHYYFRDPGDVRFAAQLGPGIEIKHRGYALLPPSRHKSGHSYLWDAGAHIRETPIAPCPLWICGRTGKRAAVAAAAVDDAVASFLGAAFGAAGWLGKALPPGKIAVRCPWAEEHSDDRGRGDDSSTVILPPTTEHRLGAFCCAHQHCERRRAEDVLLVLPKRAIAVAASKYPRALGSLAWRLARSQVEKVGR